MLRPISLCCLLLGVLVTGKILTYNEGAKRLRIQCPEKGSVDGDLLSVYVKQSAGNGKWTTLANWSYGNAAESTSNRVEVQQTSDELLPLDVYMNGVTCYDAVTYKCDILAENRNRGTFRVTNEEKLDYSGEITEPVIKQEPLKACYKSGDKMSLECTANIAQAENRLVWKTKLPGGSFSNITWQTENVQTPGEKQENATGCTLQSSFPLEYTLSEEDDGRIFQCSLIQSGQTKEIEVSVQCANNNCAEKTTSTSSPDGDADKQEILSVGESRQQNDETARTDVESGLSNNTLLILLTVIPLSLAILIVAMALFLRQWRKKQNPGPLYVVDTPTSSDSGYGYTDRRLPDLPHLHKKYPVNKQDQTTPKWLSTTSTNNLLDTTSPNTSVYVSMTGLDGLRKEAGIDGTANTEGAGPQAEGAGPQEEGVGLVDEGLEPDMRMDRSESMYSNKEAIDCAAAKLRTESMAVGASAHSTRGINLD
ncbi:uncharacterized protein [Littorina saxatilis]|uniref:uncharacterized protein n=1 Tax=Littorina saxatilis TaxID=31220 RepID=UPI0038B53C87